MKNNILLIGFMGVGKSSVARELALNLKSFYLDTDSLIEARENLQISEIFAKNGEEYFRKVEKALAKFLKNSVKNSVIATGGGFYKACNLNKIGKVIYLKASFDEIYKRLERSPNFSDEVEKRPLLKDLNKARALHKKREKDYEKIADFVVEICDKDPKKIAKEIAKFIKKGKK